MAVYIGHDECQVIYVARNGQQRRVSSIWVGDQQVFPPANRQEVHVFTRDTQGYGRDDQPDCYLFTVSVPWWATSMDVVIIGAGEKGRDGTKSFSGGSDGAGGKSGAWVVKTVALPQSPDAVVYIGKGISTTLTATSVYLPGVGGQSDVLVHDGEGTRTPNSGSTGGSVTPGFRREFGSDHDGGDGGSRNYAGFSPGGGGGGGQGSNLLGNPREGQPGGDGYVWLRFRSDAPIDGGGFTLYLGTTGGGADEPVTDWAVSIGKTRETITEITVPVSIVGPVMDQAFAWCAALEIAPEMDTSQVNSMATMFGGCSSLTTIPQYDTSNVANTDRMFGGCSSLVNIPPLDMRSVYRVDYMFEGCTSLESATLLRMGEGFSYVQQLSLSSTKLDATAANALMQSLGTVPAAANGTKLELPSTATGADTSIATEKNWTVTIG